MGWEWAPLGLGLCVKAPVLSNMTCPRSFWLLFQSSMRSGPSPLFSMSGRRNLDGLVPTTASY